MERANSIRLASDADDFMSLQGRSAPGFVKYFADSLDLVAKNSPVNLPHLPDTGMFL